MCFSPSYERWDEPQFESSPLSAVTRGESGQLACYLCLTFQQLMFEDRKIMFSMTLNHYFYQGIHTVGL